MPALTPQLETVRTKLLGVARRRETVTYSDVGRWVGMAPRPVGAKLLDPINRYEYEHDRPLLSAVVVKVMTGKPGGGFWLLATDLGLFKEGEDPIRYWKRELRRVRAYWRRQAADLQ